MTWVVDTIVETKAYGSVIEMDTKHIDSFRDIVQRHVKSVIDTEDKQIRNALIKLGWTPPNDQES